MKLFITHQLNHLDCSHHIPINILNQKEIIFRNIKDIVVLHESILPGLRECVTDDDVAMYLIKHPEHFEKYLHYMVGQAQAEACISDKTVQQYFKDITAPEKPGDAPIMDVLTFLQQPVERIQTYQALLKELIKNKAKSGQSCYLLEDAFSVVSCLPWRSDNLHRVSLIENYPAPLTALGEPGVFTVWEESPEVKTSSRGHQRQVFLFKECIVLCRVKRDGSMNRDTYSFKNKMKQLNDVEIKETVGGEDRSWGLWHEHRGSIRRYTLQSNSTLVKLSWLKDLKELQHPPVFESLLCDCSTQIGQTIKLTCRVLGFPKPVVSWIKGLPLEDDPRHIVSADRSGTCSLVLDCLTAEDSGQYMCYATSSMGSAGTLAKVVVQPPRFVSRLESACLIDGEEIQFSCSTLTTPLPRIWLKDGKELTDSNKYSIVNDARSGILSLTVIGATEADIGQYECELWNELGCVKCKAGLCPAFVPPGDSESDQSQDLPVKPNENVKIVQHGARCSLTILCPEGEDSGIYTCFTHNDSGQASCEAQLTVEEEVELGKRRRLFSVYDVHEEIGGTFGVVKRVIHRRTGEVFSAKFLPLRSSSRTRAFQERDLLSRLAHPRVACLLDFFCTRHTLVLITECCSHGLLDHLMMRGSVSEKEVQFYVQQILEGVCHIHSMNIMHLDIKPENILMVYPPKDEIKICDFGFCQEIDTSRHQYSMLGTPEFVAPEIVHQEPVTVATDIAVGVITFLLVCRCPFVGETDRATLLRVGEATLNWDAPDIECRSPEARNFLHTVLQPDPTRPSAFECLSHEWLQEDTDEINTRSLKVFISKRKWQSKDSNPSLYLSDGDEGSGSDGGRIPRGSVIRSTFYNSSQQLSPLSARHMTLRDKFQAKKQERGRKPLRRSFSGRLNEPLIEYVEDEPESNRGQRRGSVQPSMQKSSSFDNGVGFSHTNVPPHRRSRSLDEYSRRSPSSASHESAHEEEASHSMKEEITDGEAAGRNSLIIQKASKVSGRRGSVTPIVKGSAAIPGEREQSSGLETPKKRSSKLLSSFKIPPFKKIKRPSKAEVLQLDGGGVLLVWRPVQSDDPVTYCVQYGEWTVLSDEVAESCYVVKDLPKGASYVFRVGCVTRTGAGPFSEASAPIVMSTHPEIRIPLIQTDSIGSKVPGSEHQTVNRNYSFLSEINGRFSVINLCRDVETSQVFAAKITPYQAAQRQLVLREYQLLRRLHHPHLVQLYAALITPLYVLLVEELCPGKELLHSLAARDLYAESNVAELLHQIVSAADYLHSRRVIHLDLKSDNMLVDDGNHLKIIDFGSAQSFVPGRPLNIEHIHGFSDSKYIVLPKAPEILEGQGVGPETDIWAIGVLSFILSADSPFYAEHSWEQDKNIKKGKIQFGRCYPGLSEGALNFMKNSLNNKSGRPTSAECLQNPWLRAHRAPHKVRPSKVCFSTDKLRAFLKQKEEKRDQVCTKHQ
uniref:Obscurin, cytoskeletal calmodulin and titin-interacting RhoGEF a n=1 Tax=Xiphophorus couchianus TaxID=32473 RepID=A0A3B5L6K4_9TELE